MTDRIRRRSGFSLLEVIIATGILAASAVMLSSLFDTGARHIDRATRRATAQMLCEAKLAELMADSSLLVSSTPAPFLTYPGWTWSADVLPTNVPGLIQIQVNVTHLPGEPMGPDLEAVPTETMAADGVESGGDMMGATSDVPPTYSLVRWFAYSGQLVMDTTGDAAVMNSIFDATEGEASSASMQSGGDL